MTKYVRYIDEAVAGAKNIGPCETCEQRESCWNASYRLVDMAEHWERADDPFLTADSYTDLLSVKLCASGKDSLIRMLLAAMHMINDPPLFAVNR
jgi:hypothetical protein